MRSCAEALRWWDAMMTFWIIICHDLMPRWDNRLRCCILISLYRYMYKQCIPQIIKKKILRENLYVYTYFKKRYYIKSIDSINIWDITTKTTNIKQQKIQFSVVNYNYIYTFFFLINNYTKSRTFPLKIWKKVKNTDKWT